MTPLQLYTVLVVSGARAKVNAKTKDGDLPFVRLHRCLFLRVTEEDQKDHQDNGCAPGWRLPDRGPVVREPVDWLGEGVLSEHFSGQEGSHKGTGSPENERDETLRRSAGALGRFVIDVELTSNEEKVIACPVE